MISESQTKPLLYFRLPFPCGCQVCKYALFFATRHIKLCALTAPGYNSVDDNTWFENNDMTLVLRGGGLLIDYPTKKICPNSFALRWQVLALKWKS